MRAILAIARLCLSAALGYALVWAFSDPTPEWAERPPERSPRFDLADFQPSTMFAGLRLGGEAQAALPRGGADDAAADSRVAPPFDGLGFTEEALALTRQAEPLRLEGVQNEEGVWVIGYGRRLTEQPPRAISTELATQMLREDLALAQEAVRGAVHLPLNANEYGALVEFARAIGPENFPTTLVPMLLNAGDREAAADALLIWSKVRVDGALVDSDELLAERQRTRQLFLTPTPAAAASGAVALNR